MQYKCWLLRYSWSIAYRRCSNYIFILDLTPGFNTLGRDNFKTRRGILKSWDLVSLRLEVWRTTNTFMCGNISLNLGHRTIIFFFSVWYDKISEYWTPTRCLLISNYQNTGLSMPIRTSLNMYKILYAFISITPVMWSYIFETCKYLYNQKHFASYDTSGSLSRAWLMHWCAYFAYNCYLIRLDSWTIKAHVTYVNNFTQIQGIGLFSSCSFELIAMACWHSVWAF